MKLTGCLGGICFSKSPGGIPISKTHAATRPRVVSVRDMDATHWDHVTGYHWDAIHQTIVSRMVTGGIKALTDQKVLADGWRALIPYQSGQAVVIKINCNNSRQCDPTNEMDAYPETVNTVIDGLSSIGVPAEKIWITDPSRQIAPWFINKITNTNVRFYSSMQACTESTLFTDYVTADDPATSASTWPIGEVVRPAQVIVDADHLINIPLLKGHGGAGITLGLKNHYGSVVFSGDNQYQSRSRMHQYAYEGINPDPTKSVIADINNNPHIRDKTRLIIGDGIFGHPFTNTSPPQKWQIFNNTDSNILFFGTDPIAVDSVMCDYINEERVRNNRSMAIHSSLHYGHELGLGTHDHWDGFTTRQYALIDYMMVTPGNGNGDGGDPENICPAAIQLLLQ